MIKLQKDFVNKLIGGEMELRDIKELMKILKEEEMAEIKVKYGKIKLVLTNSETLSKEIPQSEKKKVEVIEKIADTPKEEVIKSKLYNIVLDITESEKIENERCNSESR